MENEEISIPTKAVTPIGDFGCQSFPLIEGNIYHITEGELSKLGKHELKWSVDEYDDDGETKTRPILIANDPTEENEKIAKRERIAELKKLLAESDYKCLKYADGEFTDEEYAEIKAQRHAWRVEINELEEELEG